MDAAALAAKLDVDQVSVAAPLLERALHLAADDASVTLHVANITIDTANNATVQLTAGVPRRIHFVAWQTPLTLGVYLDGTRGRRRDDSLDPGTRCQRPHPSRRASLTATLRRGLILGFTHIVPKGLDHILFVAGSRSCARAGAICSCSSPRSRWRTPSPSVSASTASCPCPRTSSNPLSRCRWVRRRREPPFGRTLATPRGRGVHLRPAPRPRLRRRARGVDDVQVTRLATLFSFNAGVELGQLTVLVSTLLTLSAIAAFRTRAS